MARAAVMLLGIIPIFILLALIFSDASSDTAFLQERIERLGIAAALYAAFGVALGLAIPRLSWRGGLWLNGPTLLLLFIFTIRFLGSDAGGDERFERFKDLTEPLLFYGFITVALVAACAGAYAGARIRSHFSSE